MLRLKATVAHCMLLLLVSAVITDDIVRAPSLRTCVHSFLYDLVAVWSRFII